MGFCMCVNTFMWNQLTQNDVVFQHVEVTRTTRNEKWGRLTLTNFHLDLKPSRSHQGIIYQVWPVGHTCRDREKTEKCTRTGLNCLHKLYKGLLHFHVCLYCMCLFMSFDIPKIILIKVLLPYFSCKFVILVSENILFNYYFSRAFIFNYIIISDFNL